MNRNIVTQSNAARFSTIREFDAEDASNPPSEPDDFLLGEMKGGSAAAREKESRDPKQGVTVRAVSTPAVDKWYERLLKYIPVETIGLYLALEGIIKSPEMGIRQRRFYLGATLVVSLVFTWLYLRRIAKVQLASQSLISCFALMVWVFAMGGIFATFAFYRPWQGTAALIVVTSFLAFIEPPELTAQLGGSNEDLSGV